MSSKKQNKKFDTPSSTTPAGGDDEECTFKKPSPPKSSSSEAAPKSTGADNSTKKTNASYSASSSDVESQDLSYQSSEDDQDSYSWSMKFHGSKEVVNNDPNEKINKHPPRLDSPPFRPPSPFELDADEEDDHNSPTHETAHIALSRAETDAIIDRLLNSCDGNFDGEFDDDFDPAVIKFAIVPEVVEPREGGPSTLYSTDDDDEEKGTEKKDTANEVIDLDAESDDDEVQFVCQINKDGPVLNVNPAQNMLNLDFLLERRHIFSSDEYESEDNYISEEGDEEDDDDVVFIAPNNKQIEVINISDDEDEQVEERAGSSKIQAIAPSQNQAATAVPPRADKMLPSTSKAAANPSITARQAPSSPHFSAEPALFPPDFPSSSVNNLSVAFAEVEQLLTENNERNRNFFANAPPVEPSNPSMFKRDYTRKRAQERTKDKEQSNEKEEIPEKVAKKETTGTKVTKSISSASTSSASISSASTSSASTSSASTSSASTSSASTSSASTSSATKPSACCAAPSDLNLGPSQSDRITSWQPSTSRLAHQEGAQSFPRNFAVNYLSEVKPIDPVSYVKDLKSCGRTINRGPISERRNRFRREYKILKQHLLNLLTRQEAQVKLTKAHLVYLRDVSPLLSPPISSSEESTDDEMDLEGEQRNINYLICSELSPKSRRIIEKLQEQSKHSLYKNRPKQTVISFSESRAKQLENYCEQLSICEKIRQHFIENCSPQPPPPAPSPPPPPPPNSN